MNKLIQWADEALLEQEANENAGVSKVLDGNEIAEAYNGSVAALGVSIALGDIRPALAIYYQEKSERGARPKANRRSVLDVIARMITKDTYNPQWNFSEGNRFAYNLFRHVIGQGDARIRQEVIDCSIALKQVVRTYTLV